MLSVPSKPESLAEHYPPILLAYHGLENETLCSSQSVAVIWKNGACPTSFLKNFCFLFVTE